MGDARINMVASYARLGAVSMRPQHVQEALVRIRLAVNDGGISHEDNAEHGQREATANVAEIAGELLPSVRHVLAKAARHALGADHELDAAVPVGDENVDVLGEELPEHGRPG